MNSPNSVINRQPLGTYPNEIDLYQIICRQERLYDTCYQSTLLTSLYMFCIYSLQFTERRFDAGQNDHGSGAYLEGTHVIENKCWAVLACLIQLSYSSTALLQIGTAQRFHRRRSNSSPCVNGDRGLGPRVGFFPIQVHGASASKADACTDDAQNLYRSASRIRACGYGSVARPTHRPDSRPGSR